MYKLPDINDHPSKLVKEGRGFLYIDSRTRVAKWKLSEASVKDENQPLAYTLNQYYSNKNDTVGKTDKYQGYQEYCCPYM